MLYELRKSRFFERKKSGFSVAPWSNERVEELIENLRKGVTQLTSEGLEVKEQLRNLV